MFVRSWEDFPRCIAELFFHMGKLLMKELLIRFLQLRIFP